jgi:hypothetical protein
LFVTASIKLLYLFMLNLSSQSMLYHSIAY